LAGTIDLGRAFFTWLSMRDAAQEGASYGSLQPPINQGAEQAIIDRVLDNLKQVVPDPVNVDHYINVVITLNGPDCLGSTITVDVYYAHFPLAMPFLGMILGAQEIPIHATINDTILRPTCGQP
jgi:hypothetical protein